jgi:hypothetical protein
MLDSSNPMAVIWCTVDVGSSCVISVGRMFRMKATDIFVNIFDH